MALAPLSQTIFLTEDGSVPNGEKPVTIPPMGIVPSVTLGTLTLSAPIINGVASTGTIIGSSDGSFIASTVPGLTMDSPARSYVWDGTGAAATYQNGLTETYPNATNSGRASPVTVGAAQAQSTIDNTDEESTLEVASVAGASTAFAEVDQITDALDDQLADLDGRLDALEN